MNDLPAVLKATITSYGFEEETIMWQDHSWLRDKTKIFHHPVIGPEFDRLCESASKNGSLIFLQWVHKKGYHLPSNISDLAADNGHLDILEWAHEKKLPHPTSFCHAAQGGFLGILKWAHKHLKCKFGHDTYYHAIHGNQLKVLKWLWTVEKYELSVTSCRAAAKNLEILKWLRELGCPWDEWTCATAAASGNLDSLRWARENGCPWNEFTCSYAAMSGNLNILKWARENGCPWNERTCSDAAMCGQLSILKWARENGCPWDEQTCTSAAMMDHWHIIKWVRGCPEPCPWNNHVCEYACMRGDIEIVEWLCANGFEIDYKCQSLAATNGKIELLTWMHKRGHNLRRVCIESIERGGLDVLKWAHREFGRLDNVDVYKGAAWTNNWEMMKWARENEYLNWNRVTCKDMAHWNGKLEMIKWARENGCPWGDEMLGRAIRNNRFDMLKWARSQGCPWNSSLYGIAIEVERFDIATWAYENDCPCDVITFTTLHATRNVEIRRALAEKKYVCKKLLDLIEIVVIIVFCLAVLYLITLPLNVKL